MKKCTKCGYMVEDSSMFCGKCGNNGFVTVNNDLDSDIKICPSCGTTLNISVAKCTNCGKTFEVSGQQTVQNNFNTSSQQPSGGQQQAPRPKSQQTAVATAYAHDSGSSVPTPDYVSPYYAEPTKPKKKGSIVLWIVLIFAFLTVGATAAVFVYTSNQSSTTATKDVPNQEISVDVPDGSTKTVKPVEPINEIEVKPPKKTTYDIYKEDITWTGANASVTDPDSTLVCINDAKEFETVCQKADAAGLQVFWMGISRNSEYQAWENAKWQDGTYFDYAYWYPGEPTYYDEDGSIEMYMMAFKIEGVWYFNDAPNDVTRFYTGKMGYIVETTK